MKSANQKLAEDLILSKSPVSRRLGRLLGTGVLDLFDSWHSEQYWDDKNSGMESMHAVLLFAGMLVAKCASAHFHESTHDEIITTFAQKCKTLMEGQ